MTVDEFRNDTILMNEVIERLYQRCGDEELKEICELLEKIYLVNGEVDSNFRHEYSSISGKMEELRSEFSNDESPFDLQNISININLLYNYAVKNKKIYLKNLYKLRDHICLEIGRIAYADKIYESITNAKSELQRSIDDAILEVNSIDDRIEMSKKMLLELESKHDKFSGEIDDTNISLEELKKDIDSTNTEIERTNKTLNDTKKMITKSRDKIKSYQQESIAILGIFASIVLAITGGLAFSSSVLQNFSQGTIYRVCLVILLLGIVLINILYALFYYIDRLVNDAGNRQVKPLIITNVIFTFLLFILFFMWNSGYVERIQKRNSNIYEVSTLSDNEVN